jgi:peptidoglycan lytic transglycosylase D
LVPQEYLCPVGPVAEKPDPKLALEIHGFLEKSGMLGGIPAGMASELPIVLNGPIQTYLRSFAKSKNFQASLARSGRYMPMIRKIFQDNGLPQDLVYVALVESGFCPTARSPKDAVGMWQFIEETARRYGLKVNEQVDERRDPEKSTRAAARYLLYLYKQFGCWYLAAAGYNAGEKRVEGVVNRHDTRDFWIMARKKLLPQETCNYVPQLIAAALIAKNPGKYGFNQIAFQHPWVYDRIKVPGGTDLRWFAGELKISSNDLLNLNPEIKAGKTPSDQKEYLLKVPAKSKGEAKRLARLCWQMEKIAAR